jgi:antitoxin component YwqK of YwqJK toxin-antitoxin module
MKRALMMLAVVCLVAGCPDKDGPIEERYSNGQVRSRIETIVGDDGSTIKHGHSTYWHENGQKRREGAYRDGERHGTWTSWHENGQKRSEGTYRDGKKHGAWKAWHENGQKMSEGAWRDGKQTGKWTSWRENGTKYFEGEYRDGKFVE